MGDVSKSRWISLLEYATRNNVSISTLRRKIKKRSIPFRQENGRYLLLDKESSHTPLSSQKSEQPVEVHTEVARAVDQASRLKEERRSLENELSVLKSELMDAHNEIAELKTLVAVYEESFKSDSPLK